ncbi:hypothetical protein FZW96_11135 [Bacillus sp. BGMRC 2118]|nr:hypothetical protein FZW96_11135 [Bacillus sp. BGMRC 2118]
MILKKFSLILLLAFAVLTFASSPADAAAPDRIWLGTSNGNAVYYTSYQGSQVFYSTSAYSTRYRGYLGFNVTKTNAIDARYYVYEGWLYREGLAYPGPAIIKPEQLLMNLRSSN